MAQAKTSEFPFLWEGTDKNGKKIKGQMLAPGEAFVRQSLRRQGITAQKVSKQRRRDSIKEGRNEMGM